MIDQEHLETKFARIGARMKLTVPRDRWSEVGSIRLDVKSDRIGEYFEVATPPGASSAIEVLDVQPVDRHLLLIVRERGEKSKFLCGHDERHWFVAAVPESASVGTVRTAKEALKPAEILVQERRLGLRAAARNRRKNAAYHRQGEWFFVPAPDLKVDESLVLRNEPISRGARSKPHVVEFCYRSGGETVYVCRYHPNGLLESEYRQLLVERPATKNWDWRVLRRNAVVLVRGRVRHADHKTITLHGWHRVLMNTEGQSRAMRNVAFLD
jgi:hypothetical protein